MDERLSNAWCSARKFSPNGKWLLFWEGYYDIPAGEVTDPTASNMALRALYNVETGEKTDMPTITRDPFNFDIFDITDNGTVVGYESPEATQLDQAIIFKDGKTRWLYDYLKEQGVDMDADTTILREGTDIYFIRAVGISNDEKTFAVLYYDTVGALCSMIIKLDENLTTRPPVQLEVAPLAGIAAARLSWESPLAGAEGVTGYNIYRNGVKVNGQPLTATAYIDNISGTGRYTYHVTALYGESESEASQSVEAVVEAQSIQAPRNLFARQVGYSGGLLTWDAPRTNLTVIDYYDEKDNVTGFGGGNNSFEAAIRISAEETALYKDFTINSVSFFPMTAQEAWKVNIYRKSVGGTRELIHSQSVTQSLFYGKENVVKLGSPIGVPAGADLYVAIEVTVPTDHTGYNVLGEISGEPIPGQTDLLRMTTEPDFYSLYEEGKKFGATQLTTWAIAANLAASATKVETVDVISHYNVYDGEVKVGETEGASLDFSSLYEGEHTLGVQAVYADGLTSEIETADLTIVPDESVYRPVSEVAVNQSAGGTVHFTWEVPVEDDETFITYSTDALQGGVLGPAENNYNYIAATVYDAEKMRGYEGYLIRAFRFYPLTTAVYTFFLEEDGEVVAEASVDAYTIGLWNTVKLAEPVTIKPGSTYRLLLDCYDVTPQTAPLGLDARMPFVEKGDLYSITEGATYVSVGQASAFGNWMMGLVAVSPDQTPLPIEGYTVRIDRTNVTETLLSESSFTYTFQEGTTHRINVDVCYEAGRVVSGKTVLFSVEANAIPETAVVNALRVVQSDGYVRVEGGDILAVTAVSANGQTVARADGNMLPVASLSSGIYVLHIRQPHSFAVAKMQIVK